MPDGNLPDFAKKRCDWALQFVDMGLNFLGELEFALALDETEAKKEFRLELPLRTGCQYPKNLGIGSTVLITACIRCA